MDRQKVAIVTGAPAPYREPLFQALSRRVDLAVFYCHSGHDDVGWGRDSAAEKPVLGVVSDDGERRAGSCPEPLFRSETLPNYTPGPLRRKTLLGYVNPSVIGQLRRFDPDYAIVYGYNQLTHWLTFQHCVRHRIPFAVRSDSNVRLDTSASWYSTARRKLLRWLVPRSSALLAVGSANRDFWRRYGATSEQICMAPFAVDNQRIAGIASPRTLSDRVRILYVGRLVRRKGVDLLIHAFNRLAPRDEATLTIVGDGPELEYLQSLQSSEAQRRTKWLGKLPNDDAIRQYANADVLVLPSRHEPWGLVVNEAMAAGVPVVAGPDCGAALDLIDDGITGRLLPELSAPAIEQTLNLYLRAPSRLREMGRAARLKIQSWSIDRTVDGFLSAIHQRTATSEQEPAIAANRSRAA